MAAGRANNYSAHLDRLTGEEKPVVFRVDSTRPELPPVTVLWYPDLPEDGLATAFTYGVSLVEHPEWVGGSAELSLCVRSLDTAWPRALGLLGEQLRGVCPFAYGNTINFGEAIAPDTEMTAFFVFASTVVEREDAVGVDIGEPDREDLVTIQALYPIHDVERRFIDERGLDPFWYGEWDTYDVSRPPAV